MPKYLKCATFSIITLLNNSRGWSESLLGIMSLSLLAHIQCTYGHNLHPKIQNANKINTLVHSAYTYLCQLFFGLNEHRNNFIFLFSSLTNKMIFFFARFNIPFEIQFLFNRNAPVLQHILSNSLKRQLSCYY